MKKTHSKKNKKEKNPVPEEESVSEESNEDVSVGESDTVSVSPAKVTKKKVRISPETTESTGSSGLDATVMNPHTTKSITYNEPSSEPIIEAAPAPKKYNEPKSLPANHTLKDKVGLKNPPPAPPPAQAPPAPEPSIPNKITLIVLREIMDIEPAKLRKTFNSNHFDITETNFDSKNEIASYINALKLSKRLNPNEGCIIVKEDTTSMISSEQIWSYCINLVNDDNFDMLYLNSYMDQCSKQVKSKVNENFKMTFAPKGYQCILYTREGRDKIIGDKKLDSGNNFNNTGKFEDNVHNGISKKDLLVLMFNSNLVNYDSTYAKTSKDYNKLNECADVEESTTSSTSNWKHHIWWIVLIVLVILFILLIVLYFSFRKRD